MRRILLLSNLSVLVACFQVSNGTTPMPNQGSSFFAKNAANQSNFLDFSRQTPGGPSEEHVKVVSEEDLEDYLQQFSLNSIFKSDGNTMEIEPTEASKAPQLLIVISNFNEDAYLQAKNQHQYVVSLGDQDYQYSSGALIAHVDKVLELREGIAENSQQLPKNKIPLNSFEKIEFKQGFKIENFWPYVDETHGKGTPLSAFLEWVHSILKPGGTFVYYVTKETFVNCAQSESDPDLLMSFLEQAGFKKISGEFDASGCLQLSYQKCRDFEAEQTAQKPEEKDFLNKEESKDCAWFNQIELDVPIDELLVQDGTLRSTPFERPSQENLNSNQFSQYEQSKGSVWMPPSGALSEQDQEAEVNPELREYFQDRSSLAQEQAHSLMQSLPNQSFQHLNHHNSQVSPNQTSVSKLNVNASAPSVPKQGLVVFPHGIGIPPMYSSAYQPAFYVSRQQDINFEQPSVRNQSESKLRSSECAPALGNLPSANGASNLSSAKSQKISDCFRGYLWGMSQSFKDQQTNESLPKSTFSSAHQQQSVYSQQFDMDMSSGAFNSVTSPQTPHVSCFSTNGSDQISNGLPQEQVEVQSSQPGNQADLGNSEPFFRIKYSKDDSKVINIKLKNCLIGDHNQMLMGDKNQLNQPASKPDGNLNPSNWNGASLNVNQNHSNQSSPASSEFFQSSGNGLSFFQKQPERTQPWNSKVQLPQQEVDYDHLDISSIDGQEQAKSMYR